MSATTVERPTADAPEGTSSRLRRTRAVWAPLLASVALVVVASGRIDAAFSPSYEGFNTAVWATGARSVQQHGWWEARLGGRAVRDGYPTSYAHHPPLTQVEASVAGSVLGDHRWAYRLMALLSTIAAVWCCWGWLGACGFSPGARSLGTLVVAGTPLVLGFGLMLNMEITWMPLCFGLLWAWRRAGPGDTGGDGGGGPAVLCGALALAGSTAAHQGILLAVGLGVLGLVQARRGRRPVAAATWATLAGGAVGSLVFLGWVRWASGGFSDLWHIAAVRSRVDQGLLQAVQVQGQRTTVLFGLVGVTAVVAGLALVRDRPDLVGVEVVVVVLTVAYAEAFRAGSTHVYWNAALLPAVALGAALVGDRLARRSAASAVNIACVVAVALLALGVGTYRRPPAEEDFGLAARQAGRSSAQLASTVRTSDWATYESGASVSDVRSCPAVVALARRSPDEPVLTSRAWVVPRVGAGRWDELAARASVRRGSVVVAPATVVADEVCR